MRDIHRRGRYFFALAFTKAICLIAVLTSSAITPAIADTPVTVRQGWTDSQKKKWYTLSQGSRLIPLSWLKALEQADSDRLFLDDEHITKLRYLPSSAATGDRLPVGFVVDDQDDSDLTRTRLRWKWPQSDTEKWVGMNCAACHTAEITYQGKRMRIEGGPTLGDFQTLMEALNTALARTKSEPKWTRFADKVLGTENNADNKTRLRAALDKLTAWEDRIARANATPLRYGFGRLDAFGHIFNKVALNVQEDGAAPISNPSNAPVSYPFLWNVPQHDKVQWNGFAEKQMIGGYDVGALGRNIGEVTGVFADVSWVVNAVSATSTNSSVDTNNLRDLENLLKTLRPPMWPTSVFGQIDNTLRSRGREVFIDPNRRNADGSRVTPCRDCHKGLRRNNLTRPIEAKMIPLKESGTDIWMACNVVTHRASTGVLINTYGDGGQPYGATAQTKDLASNTVKSIVLENLEDVASDIIGLFGSPSSGGLGSDSEAPSALPANERPVRSLTEQSRRNRCLNGTDELLKYKARPLTGIWATAPYLHNGSVPTLYDLLLPPDQRPKSFAVGTREFDKKRVGFVTRDASDNIAPPSGDNSFPFKTRDDNGRMIDGNSNAGHDYGNATLSESDRWALVEYMKGL